jgi:hypothetical protein
MKQHLSLSVFRVIVTGLLASLCGILGVASTSHAVASDPKVFISGDNTFYAYAVGGETLSASFLKSSQTEPVGLAPYDITVSLDGPGLPQQTCTIPKNVSVGKGCGFDTVVAPQTGIYKVSFSLPAEAKPYPEVSPTVKWGGNLFSWNVTVKDGTAEKKGRVWSELYAIRQPNETSFVADLTYHYVSESGAIYRAAYKGFNGQISTFSADAVGVRTGDECVSAYQSIAVTDDKRSPSFGVCGGSYKLFFEQPAGELPKKALQWDSQSQEWVVPAVIAPKVSDLKFESNKTGDMQSGKISYKLSNFVGQYTIDIDTTGDGSFTSKEDIRVKRTMKKVDNSLQQYEFDGVDARGQVVSPTQPITIRINVEKVAEIHLVNADVEGRTGGLELVRLSGENAPSSRMCWNDTDLPRLATASLETKTVDGRNCPDSTSSALHGWPYATNSWGDQRYIDDWAYATTKVEGTSQIQYPDSNEPIVSAGTRNTQRLIMLAVGAGLIALFGLLIFIVITRRKKQKERLRRAEYSQPLDFPGPGDPGQPRL